MLLDSLEAPLKALAQDWLDHPNDWHRYRAVARHCQQAGSQQVLAELLQFSISRLQNPPLEAWHELGRVHSLTGNWEAARSALAEAVRLAPAEGRLHRHLGHAHFQVGDWAAARSSFDQALKLGDTHYSTYEGLGGATYRLGDLTAAADAMGQAFALGSGSQDSFDLAGCIAYARRDFEAARHWWEQALALNAHAICTLNNLGTLALETGYPNDALAWCQRAVALCPSDVRAQHQLGLVYQRLGHWREAAFCFERAIKLDPNHADARLSHAEMQLRLGQYAEGWAGYEWRFQRPEHHRVQDFESIPLWQGEPLAGKVLLVHAEQGYGDTLQFLRCLWKLADAGTLDLAVQPRLLRLVQAAGLPVRQVLPTDATPPAADVRIPLLSLPHRLRLGNPAAWAAPPLPIDPAWAEPWADRLPARTVGRPRLGLAWTGRPTHRLNTLRSLPPEDVRWLVSHLPADWVCLQPEPGLRHTLPSEAARQIHFVGEDLYQFYVGIAF